jgi:hypothetical protein
MTFERKIVVGLEDIKAVIFQCNRCGSRIVLTPQSLDSLPKVCPQDHPWKTNIPVESYNASTLNLFTITLKKLVDRLHEDNGFKVYLEFEEPKANAN